MRALVERQIAGNRTPTFGHVLDLRPCLVEPMRMTMDVLVGNVEHAAELWLVLEERPGFEQRGYRIAYDEDENEFGLAIDGKSGRLLVIGYYGDFMETVAAM